MAVQPAVDNAPLRWCSQCHAAYRAEFARCPSDGAVLEAGGEDPLIGATVGEHYVIEGFVGEGGMGRVYRARHTRLQHRQFAIKILLGDLAVAISTRMRFAQEADTASRLDHPNVVPVVDFGKTETGLMYLAMELVTGRTLGALIDEEAPLAPTRVIALARQMCLGLAHAHSLDLIHRDFKPDNVIVVERETGEVPRILDFGLAISHEEDKHSARLTTAGIALGTPAYAAPEQALGESIDARADLFALGVTLFEMLTGKTPHDGTPFEVIRLNARDAPPPMSSRCEASVPQALEALVARLLRRRPADRYASVTEVIAALDALDLAAIEPPPAIARAGAPARAAAPKGTAESIESGPETPSHPATTLATTSSASKRWLALPALAVTTGVVLVLALTGTSERPSARASAPVTAATAPVMPPPSMAPLMPAPAAAAPVAPPASSVSVTEPMQPFTRPPPIARLSPKRTSPPASPTPALPTPALASAGSAASSTAVRLPAIADAPVEPSTEIKTPMPTPAPSPPPVARTLLTRSVLTGLSTRGSLSTVVVRRAIDRTMPEIADCARRAAVSSATPTQVARATFVIDDSRRATSIAISGTAAPPLVTCVSRALTSVRTADAPDVGTVSVTIDIGFATGPT